VGNYADEGGSIWLDESAGAIHDCIIAFGAGGGAIGDDGTQWDPSSSTQVTRCVVHDNAGGDDLCCDVYDNVVADPRFCGFSVWDFTLCANSPCLPENNAWSVQVGAHGQGCADCDTPVETTSWGAIKALYR
jgi:hypothetical protein